MSNTVPVPTVNGVANGEFFSCHYSVVDLFVEFFKNFTSYKFVAIMSPKIMHNYDQESCSSNCDFGD